MGDIFKTIGNSLTGAYSGQQQGAPAQVPQAQDPGARAPQSFGDILAALLGSIGQHNPTVNYLGQLGR